MIRSPTHRAGAICEGLHDDLEQEPGGALILGHQDMKGPIMVPVSCFPRSPEKFRPSSRPPAVVNLSPDRGSGKPASSRGDRRSALSIQS